MSTLLKEIESILATRSEAVKVLSERGLANASIEEESYLLEEIRDCLSLIG